RRLSGPRPPRLHARVRVRRPEPVRPRGPQARPRVPRARAEALVEVPDRRAPRRPARPRMSTAAGRPVRVGGLDGVLLARSERGDGRHQVVSARLGGRDVVVKIYGRKRALLPTWLRAFGHRFLVGKTGLSARTRRDTEARLLGLWRDHGFAVPGCLGESL